MGRILLLGMPLLGLVLFFILSFERALISYLVFVLLVCLFYYQITERADNTKPLKD
ncbi:MAG: hypothetical protein NT075_29055 [Chloroflexi bacterium]|nr:hypothetical protein [Chloroflexota bacterium]